MLYTALRTNNAHAYRVSHGLEKGCAGKNREEEALLDALPALYALQLREIRKIQQHLVLWVTGWFDEASVSGVDSKKKPTKPHFDFLRRH